MFSLHACACIHSMCAKHASCFHASNRAHTYHHVHGVDFITNCSAHVKLYFDNCLYVFRAFTPCCHSMQVVSMRVIVHILIIMWTEYCTLYCSFFITKCSTHVKVYFDHCLHVFPTCMCMDSLHVCNACKLFPCE